MGSADGCMGSADGRYKTLGSADGCMNTYTDYDSDDNDDDGDDGPRW